MPLPIEIAVLGWSTLLLFVHIAIQGQTMTRERGMGWGAGARDGEPAPLGPLAGRADRALANYLQTYPGFAAVALALAVTDRTGGLGQVGAMLWLGGRIVYLPLYVAGVPWLRSVAWLVASAGIVTMLVRLL